MSVRVNTTYPYPYPHYHKPCQGAWEQKETKSNDDSQNNKAPGADNMPAELLKCGGDELVRHIHKLIMDIWKKEYVLEEWRKERG
jgi:hypothetical protein